MPALYGYSETELLAFFLVLVRMSAFTVSWPVFGVANVPAPVKVLFALLLAILVFPVTDWAGVKTELASMEIVWLAIREGFIGLSMGFLARMFFFAVSICGEIVSASMGLSTGSIFNPEMGTQTTSIEQFQAILATLFFLGINGHHVLLSGLVDSFNIAPLASTALDLGGLGEVGKLTQTIVEMGLKFSAPVMISILCLNITMGIVGRAVPQINVLITSLPVNILAGFLIMIVSLPILVSNMGELMQVTAENVFRILKSY